MRTAISRGLAALSAAGVTVVLLASCSAGSSIASDGGATVAAAPSAEQSTADPSAAHSIASTAEGWIAGNLVTLTASEFEPTTGVITVTADVSNTSGVDGFTADYYSWIGLDTGAGAPLTPSAFSSTSVPGRIVEIEIEFAAPEEGVDLTNAVLELGAASDQQWLLPLSAGAGGDGTEPAEIPLDDVADAAGLTFTSTAAQLVPWTCTDSDDYGPNRTGRVTFEPVADDKLGILVVGDFQESVAYTGGNSVPAIRILQPDGRTVNHNGAVWTVFAQGDVVEDYVLCFTVDAPVAGDYVVSFDTYRGGTASFIVPTD